MDADTVFAMEESAWSANDEAMLFDGLVEVIEERTRCGIPQVTINRRGRQMLLSIPNAQQMATDILTDLHNAHRDSYVGKYLCLGRNDAQYMILKNGWCIGLDEAQTIAENILAAIHLRQAAA